MPNREDNDWPDEVKGIRKLKKEETQFTHDLIPPQRAEEAEEDYQKQLQDEDRKKDHPAYRLRDKD